MPIPDFESLMLPVLRVLADCKEHSVADVRRQIAAELHLSEQELSERLASDTTTVFLNRIGWAVKHLKEAIAIRAVHRGVYVITERGLSLIKTHGSEVTVRTLRQFPEFEDFKGKEPVEHLGLSETPSYESKDTKATPEEILEKSYKILRDTLADELLETAKGATPAAFERIVVDLLVAMGYGGSVEDPAKMWEYQRPRHTF